MPWLPIGYQKQSGQTMLENSQRDQDGIEIYVV
jgi:hypothetical protein